MANALPALREDIRIHQVEENNWAIYDMASQKYFKVTYLPFLILSNWGTVTTEEELYEKVNKRHSCTPDEVAHIVQFCKEHFLTKSSEESLAKIVSIHHDRSSVPILKQLVHNYLFFKIHLFNPNRFLEKTLFLVKPIFSERVKYTVLLLLSINLLLIANNFSEYLSTLVNFVSLEGLVYLGVSIVLLKTAHEFAHAYVTKYYGCSVPSMGIAFMVFYPMPYTDTTSAWMLKPSQRANIALAGIRVEMIIATIALGGWLLLPDGILKSLAFFLSGVSIVMTLAINLSPFMRFDGYYALSDLWRIENLHTRSFTLAKAFLRKKLWGMELKTEFFPPKKKKLLIVFALGVWVYRLILFTGIAYMVYLMTFKVLGIVLFAIEIGYFIMLPIFKELKEWYKLRSQIRFSYSVIASWAVVLLPLSLLFIPYSRTTLIPTIVESETKSVLFSEYDSHIVYKNEADSVKKGDLILVGESINNDLDKNSALRKLGYFEHQLKNAMTSEESLQDFHKLAQSAIAERIKISAAQSLHANMKIAASQQGTLQYDTPINTGEYVGIGQNIGILFDPNSSKLIGYVEDTDLAKLHVGDLGDYYDPTSLETFAVMITKIETAPSERIDEILLDSTYGGPIRVKSKAISERPNYKIYMAPVVQRALKMPYKHYGYVKFKTNASSFIHKVTSYAASALIEESSF